MKERESPPKFVQIVETLRARILDGTYPVGGRLPSENELPAEFGVGKQTIVRVMSELTQEGLIVRRQGRGTYVASHSVEDPARRQAVRALRIGLVLRREVRGLDLSSGGWTESVARGIAEGLGLPREGIRFDRLPGPRDKATRASLWHPAQANRIEVLGEPPDVDTGVPLDEVFAADLDGLLTLSIFDDEYLARLLAHAAKKSVPSVIVDYWTKELGARADCVVADNFPGYLAACEWLIAKGLRRIHFVGVYNASHTPGHFRDPGATCGRIEPDSYLRMSAYRQALNEAGIDAPEDWIHICRPLQGSEIDLANRLCALGPGRRPEAVVCHQEDMARTVREVFASRGEPVESLGVDIRNAPNRGPAITLDAVEIGRAAVSTLEQRIQERANGARPRLPVKVAVPTRFQADR